MILSAMNCGPWTCKTRNGPIMVLKPQSNHFRTWQALLSWKIAKWPYLEDWRRMSINISRRQMKSFSSISRTRAGKSLAKSLLRQLKMFQLNVWEQRLYSTMIKSGFTLVHNQLQTRTHKRLLIQISSLSILSLDFGRKKQVIQRWMMIREKSLVKQFAYITAQLHSSAVAVMLWRKSALSTQADPSSLSSRMQSSKLHSRKLTIIKHMKVVKVILLFN